MFLSEAFQFVIAECYIQKHNPFVNVTTSFTYVNLPILSSCTFIMMLQGYELITRENMVHFWLRCSKYETAIFFFVLFCFVLHSKKCILFIKKLTINQSSPGNLCLCEIYSLFMTHLWLIYVNWCDLTKWTNQFT